MRSTFAPGIAAEIVRSVGTVLVSLGVDDPRRTASFALGGSLELEMQQLAPPRNDDHGDVGCACNDDYTLSWGGAVGASGIATVSFATAGTHALSVTCKTDPGMHRNVLAADAPTMDDERRWTRRRGRWQRIDIEHVRAIARIIGDVVLLGDVPAGDPSEQDWPHRRGVCMATSTATSVPRRPRSRCTAPRGVRPVRPRAGPRTTRGSSRRPRLPGPLRARV